jgi:queuine tRNA-ribosyltransferase
MGDFSPPMNWAPRDIAFTALTGTTEGARRCRFHTAHGVVDTPSFMPVGTRGTIKGLTPHQVAEAGAPAVVLANTFHLFLQPGPELVARHGGLHRFMGWNRSILTDSGGFQVFSLPEQEVSDAGVSFADPRKAKGARSSGRIWFDAEESIRVQELLGSDIAMCFDECVGADATEADAEAAVARTSEWAARCRHAHARPDQLLFGIVQGFAYRRLRERSAREIASLGFDGYAIGGVSVGEGTDRIREVVAYTAPLLPADRPRYLMGVGLPEDILESVAAGCDLFDCVIPARFGRGGTLFTRGGKVRIRDKRYRRDLLPVDKGCGCYACGTFTRAYLHHLFSLDEPLAATLATVHNLCFYQDLMAGIRGAIEADEFTAFHERFLDRYLPKTGRRP